MVPLSSLWLPILLSAVLVFVASSIVHMVLQRSLAEFSERGRVVLELDDPDVRQPLVGRYRLLCAVHADAVWVMRIVHGNRDFLLALGVERAKG